MALLTLFLQLFAAVRKRFRPWHKFLQVFLWNIISRILFQLFHQKLKILKRIQPIGFRCFCNRIQECTCLCSFLGIYDVPAMFPNAEFFDAAFRVIIIQRMSASCYYTNHHPPFTSPHKSSPPKQHPQAAIPHP